MLEWSIPSDDVLRHLAGRVDPEGSVLVGVDGRAGSGKTSFAGWLAGEIEQAGMAVRTVHTDAFFRPSAERLAYPSPLAVVADLDWRRLRDQVLRPLRAGRTARFQLYDWSSDTLAEWQEIDPGGVAIVDGIVSTRSELSDLYDLRVWLTCRREVRIPRLLARAGASAAEVEHWLPSEDAYVEAHAPRTSAHFVVHSIQR